MTDIILETVEKIDELACELLNEHMDSMDKEDPIQLLRIRKAVQTIANKRY